MEEILPRYQCCNGQISAENIVAMNMDYDIIRVDSLRVTIKKC